LVCGVDCAVQLTVVNNTAIAHVLTLAAESTVGDLVLTDPVIPLGSAALCTPSVVELLF
jgi:hypothetical protein